VTADVDSPSIFLGELSDPVSVSDEARSEATEPSSSRGHAGSNPITAEVDLKFTWGGYDFVVRAVGPDGVVVSTNDSRTTTLPFGWSIRVKGQTRTLAAPATAQSRRASGPISEADSDVYQALKAWRLEQAKADKVPAYVIFKDQTLDELSRLRPRTAAELLGISGIGPAKIDRYGDQILAVIEDSIGH
jgi:superfamily II DNA helicase RecQ